MYKKIGNAIKYVFNKNYRFIYNASKGKYNDMPDEEYLKKMYLVVFGKRLNLEYPRSFNEKLQWLKLYDRNSIYPMMVDKHEVKYYVSNIIGDEYIIPTLGVWDSFSEINFEILPNKFVLKCTHDSGSVIICKDKSSFDFKQARKKINQSLKSNYYLHAREWPYKQVKPRIIAEMYIEDNEHDDLRDYKFFCFNGKAKFFKIDFDRFIEHHANYYDVETKKILPFGEKKYPPIYDKELKIPYNISEMVNLAEKLSANIPFVRIDFYTVNNKIYFGEFTFYPAAGFGKFIPDDWDIKLGDMLILP